MAPWDKGPRRDQEQQPQRPGQVAPDDIGQPVGSEVDPADADAD